MGKNKKLNKKNIVRFTLVNGTDQKGNHMTIFKPVQTKTKLQERNRMKVINQLSDYQVQINGKPADESEIPQFVLEQIKGRMDLIFNQKNPDLFKSSQNEDEDIVEEEMIEEDEWDDENEQFIPEEEYMHAQQTSKSNEKSIKIEKKQQINKNMQQTNSSPVQINIDGQSYKLTQKQIKILNEVLPQNYENYEIQGIQFTKYDQFGNNINEREKYKKYIVEEKQRREIATSFNYVPEKPINVVDNDMSGQVLKGDIQEVEEALNYDGEDGAYDELEDDFFAKLIRGNQKKNINNSIEKRKQPQRNQPITKKQTQKIKKQVEHHQKQEIKKVENIEEQHSDDQWQDEDNQEEYDEQQITDQMLDKAIQQFDKKKENSTASSQQVQTISGTRIPIENKGSDLLKLIQQREECLGKDGQLDWRTLTKKEKKQYMKNKKIKDIYQQVRKKEIDQKLKGKHNIKPEQLHLKQYTQHIPYQEDHIMQQSMKRDQQQIVDLQNNSDFETESDEDDIISYRAKTSIISSNLATVEEPPVNKKKKKKNGQFDEKGNQTNDKQIIKVIPEKRNRTETTQQRKQRKQKLKEMKKQKKQQRKEFNQMFVGERKKVLKQSQNANKNPLNKISHTNII